MTLNQLNDKRIIITGTSSGIGQALSRQCLEEGALVYGISHEETLAFKDYPNYHHRVFDLRDLSELENVLNQGVNVLRGIDILILNAGVAFYKTVQTLTETDQKTLLELNIQSVVLSYKWLLNIKKDAPFRCMVTSSVMAGTPFPGYAFYSATKAFVSTYFKAARYELNQNQQIHIVYPVATKTAFFNVAGQPHDSLFMQTPDYVAKKMIIGFKKNQKDIYLSRLFRIISHFFPVFLKGLMKKEMYRLKSHEEKK